MQWGCPGSNPDLHHSTAQHSTAHMSYVCTYLEKKMDEPTPAVTRYAHPMCPITLNRRKDRDCVSVYIPGMWLIDYELGLLGNQAQRAVGSVSGNRN